MEPTESTPFHTTIYRRPTFKCEDLQLETQLQYYIHGDESRRAQNTIIEFAISLKTQKRKNAKTQSFYYAFKCGPTVTGYLCESDICANMQVKLRNIRIIRTYISIATPPNQIQHVWSSLTEIFTKLVSLASKSQLG